MLFYKRATVEWHPVGVVGAIVPWNYPFHNILGPVTAAVLAGDAIVVKVSEHASWSANFYSRFLEAALAACGAPTDLVQIVTGFGETGDALVRANVDKLIFIGSVGVGRKVAEAAADSLTPVVMELGGKDAVIVCPGADLEQVYHHTLRGGLQSCGQNCVGAERFFIHDSCYDGLVPRVAEQVRAFCETQPAPEQPLAIGSGDGICLITGGAGFIGHHVVEHFCVNTQYQICVLDKLSYASKGYDRLRDSGVFHRIQTYTVDLTNPIPPGLAYELGTGRVEVIIHIAAETHVDNSITDPVPFVENNVRSTLHLLEYARNCPNLKHFIYFSTDEVYGSAEQGEMFKEGDAHKPSNPYSASKSAAEMICHSYFNTYKVPLITMNVMNAFGERQHPEKFIPLCINKIRAGEEITIHSCAPHTIPYHTIP